jgi:phage terminase large subunit GpA-like protein
MGARDLELDLVDAQQRVDEVLRQYAALPQRVDVSTWSQQSIILSAKDSAEPGPYRVERTPYAREPMDALSQHSPVEEVVLMWGAQTGKTRIGSNWLGYLVDTNPGPVMIVQPTIDLAKRYSRQRLAPMIEESPALRAKVRENRSRDDANTTLLKEFAGGFMAVAGANSAAGLRSMPVRDLFLDEVDGYPLDVDGEGDPIKLAEARQSTFSRRKRLLTSTPTTRDFSRVEARYLASDRCRFHVPCPHCQELQPLEWGTDKTHGIKWDRDPEGRALPDSVRYVCRACGAEIREHHKPAMLAAGRWVADAPGSAAGRVRGFQLSSLYSPLGWLSWATLVQEWEAAITAARTGDISVLRVFVNTRLAETFEEQGDRADEHALRKRAADIPLRQVHWGLFVMTAGVDVQGDRLEAYLWAWGRGLERQMVDRAVFYGDPGLAESDPGSPWARLTEWRRTPVLHASGKPVPILAVMIDSGGHHTHAVYAYARAHQHAHVYACKGMSQAGRNVIGKPTDQDVSWRGQKIKHGVKLWPIGTDTAKAEIYGRLRTEQPGPGYVHLSRHLPPEVFEQLTSERLVTKYVKGRPRLEWVKPAGRRNEALDCAVYALAAAHFAGIDRWKEGDWARWESRVQARDLFDAAQATQPEQPGAGQASDQVAEQAGEPSTEQPVPAAALVPAPAPPKLRRNPFANPPQPKPGRIW